MEAHSAPLGPQNLTRWRRRLAPATDERLAGLVRDGSDEAFATLYERYHQRLYRYSRSILGSDSDAQDALQSTFAGAFVALSQGRRDAPVRPWLYRIAHNESVSILRRRRPEAPLDEAHGTPTPSAAEQAGERARLQQLVGDLGQLSERQRGALVMRELGGLSHAEVAIALDLDSARAKQAVFEARRSLQELSEGRAMQCDAVCRAISAGGGRTLRARKLRAHLRDCASCRAFAQAISIRSRDLNAIAPPLGGLAAASILRRAIDAASPSGSGGAATAAKVAGVSLAGKAAAGAAIVAVAAAGGGLVMRVTPQHSAGLTVRSSLHRTAAGSRPPQTDGRSLWAGSRASAAAAAEHQRAARRPTGSGVSSPTPANQASGGSATSTARAHGHGAAGRNHRGGDGGHGRGYSQRARSAHGSRPAAAGRNRGQSRAQNHTGTSRARSGRSASHSTQGRSGRAATRDKAAVSHGGGQAATVVATNTRKSAASQAGK